MANKEQVILLKQGKAGWNAWRKSNPSILVDLHGARLSEVNLRKADFSGADLRGPIYRGRNFKEQILADRLSWTKLLRRFRSRREEMDYEVWK